LLSEGITSQACPESPQPDTGNPTLGTPINGTPRRKGRPPRGIFQTPLPPLPPGQGDETEPGLSSIRDEVIHGTESGEDEFRDHLIALMDKFCDERKMLREIVACQEAKLTLTEEDLDRSRTNIRELTDELMTLMETESSLRETMSGIETENYLTRHHRATRKADRGSDRR
jgi:hypothetical protein